MSAPVAESVTEGGCTVSWAQTNTNTTENLAPERGWWCASRGLTVVERRLAQSVAEAKRQALEWLEDELRGQAVRAIAAAQRVKARRVSDE